MRVFLFGSCSSFCPASFAVCPFQLRKVVQQPIEGRKHGDDENDPDDLNRDDESRVFVQGDRSRRHLGDPAGRKGENRCNHGDAR